LPPVLLCRSFSDFGGLILEVNFLACWARSQS
jgi:hypothetical protein